MSGIRLNKYIASSGLCSRRKADELIEQGSVNVNGKIVKELGYLVQPKDKVFINQKLIRPAKHEYYRFYKPAGYITTADDEKGRKTIYDLLPENLLGLKPVGRLDKDSTGLLILTNDGDLINELTHPSVKVPKIYLVSVDSRVHKHELEQMANGIEIEPDKTAYADIQVIEMDNKHTVMRITLYQGLNRQIRKMFEHFGYEVKTLKRIQHATLTLDGLKRGEFKPIKPIQIRELKNFFKQDFKAMKRIAVSGNIASGKTTVQKILEKQGYKVLDTDDVSRDILTVNNKTLYDAFKDYDVFENGEFSRYKVAQLIFSDEPARLLIASIMHPQIAEVIKKFFEENKSEELLFVGIPLLFEAKMENLFDKIIFVYTDDDIRLERLLKRNSYTLEHAKARINSQMPQDEKVKLSDYLVNNNGNLSGLEGQVAKLIEQIR